MENSIFWEERGRQNSVLRGRVKSSGLVKCAYLDMYLPREGVIIECPLNYLFHDVVTVIITCRNVRIMGNDDWEMTVSENHKVKVVING